MKSNCTIQNKRLRDENNSIRSRLVSMLASVAYQIPSRTKAACNGVFLQQIPKLVARACQQKQFFKCNSPAALSIYYHSGNSNQKLLGSKANGPFYKCFSSSLKKEGFQIKSVEGAEILQNVLQKNKQLLQEKKNVLIQDIRERKEKVKERVEEVIERENVATIPNLLCVGRIALSPYLGYVIVQSDFSLAMGLLIVAGLTDLADGYIARCWPSQASRLGSFLDPMADKILVGSLVISMSYVELLPYWLTGMILFRDLFLIGAGFVIRYISLPQPRTLSRYFDVTHATAQLAPTFISKVNTAVQLATVAITLGAPVWNYVDHPYLHMLWYLTGITTVAAAISYAVDKNTYKILKQQKP